LRPSCDLRDAPWWGPPASHPPKLSPSLSSTPPPAHVLSLSHARLACSRPGVTLSLGTALAPALIPSPSSSSPPPSSLAQRGPLPLPRARPGHGARPAQRGRPWRACPPLRVRPRPCPRRARSQPPPCATPPRRPRRARPAWRGAAPARRGHGMPASARPGSARVLARLGVVARRALARGAHGSPAPDRSGPDPLAPALARLAPTRSPPPTVARRGAPAPARGDRRARARLPMPWRSLELVPTCLWRAALSLASAHPPTLGPDVARRCSRRPCPGAARGGPAPPARHHGAQVARHGPVPRTTSWRGLSCSRRDV
jgi:hypothetical protein